MSDADQERREIMNLIDFGIEVEAFIKSKVGQYLIKRAEQEIEGALDALKTVKPEDVEAIRALQSTIKRAESIQYWMAEAIENGRNSEQQLLENGE